MKTINSFLIVFSLFFASTFISNAQTARLQVIHNSPDAAAAQVDVYLNGVLTLNDFAFRTATPFITAPAGVTINIGIAPSTSMSVMDTIVNFPVVLNANETYVAIASGIVSPSGYSPNIPFSLFIYSGARESASMAGHTDVLVFHGSTDAPTVDVVESGVGAGTLVNDINLHNFQGYLELPTDNYILDIATSDQSAVVARYQAPLSTLGLTDSALVVVASGFLNPVNNSNGEAFGLYVALPSGGDLIPLPVQTGVKEENINVLNIFPNPSSDYVYVDLTFEGYNTIDLFLYDNGGRMIKDFGSHEVYGTSNKVLDLSDVPTGSYHLMFRYEQDFEMKTLNIIR